MIFMDWYLKIDGEPKESYLNGNPRTANFAVNGKYFLYTFDDSPCLDNDEKLTFILLDEYREGAQEEVMKTLREIMDTGSDDRRDAFDVDDIGIWDLIEQHSYKELKTKYDAWKKSTSEQADFEAACDAFYQSEKICDLIRKGYSFEIKMTKGEKHP